VGKQEIPMYEPNKKNDAVRKKEVRPGILIFSILIVLALVIGMAMLKHTQNATHQEAKAVNISPNAEPAGTDVHSTLVEVPQDNSNPTKAPRAVAVNNGNAKTAANDVQKLIATLTDPSVSAVEKKQAIRTLVRNGSPTALAALKQALASGSKDLRGAVAKGLGDCDSPECAKILTELINDPSIDISRAAIQGLAQQGSAQSVETLSKLLNDPSRAAELRMDAAEGLGSINQPGVLEALSNAALTIQDDDVVTQVLNALGTRDFNETKDFFNNYLHSPSISSDMRVAAIEALGQAKGSPTDFLLALASDGDPDVRVAAAWAMSTTEETGKAGAQLVSLLQGESDPDVRLRLYQALSNQEGYDLPSVLNAVRSEKDASAIVSGLGLLAKNLRDNPTPELQTFFNQIGYAQLKTIAMSGETSEDRLQAVIPLVRANTPSAISALQELSQQAPDPRVKQSAASALRGFARQ
jgi:HEAT repeat protein